MIDVDIWFAYALGTSVHQLPALSPSQPEMAIIYLDSARRELTQFRAHPLCKLMKKSFESAGTLIESIESIGPIKNLHEQKISELAWLVIEFERELREEFNHLYAICIEGQGLFSSYQLVEKIESVFSRWDRFTRETKRELEEAGFCLACERYTAAGFHSLRGLEIEVRDYVIVALQAMPKKRDLGHYVEVLKAYGSDQKLIAVLDNVRSLERNPLMHPEDWLDRDAATELFCIVQGALSRLIADMDRKGLLPPPEGGQK